MISIVIPLYNKGERIKLAIDSALHQDYDGEWEIVVVDDGSTDDSAEYVKAYKDDKVVYVYQPNAGVSAARNRGIAESKGEWIVFLDADDLLLPCALSTFDSMHQKYQNCRFLVGSSIWRRKDCIVSQAADSGIVRHSIVPHFSLFRKRFYAAPRNMCIHRSLLDQQGGFDNRMSFYEDTEFVYRMLEKSEVAYTDRNISIYEQDGQGLSASLHPVEKEMAYYVPEIIEKLNPGLWYKALLYENIELTKLWWQNNPEILAFYKNMQSQYFSWIYPKLHWIRQQLFRHGWL